MSKVTMIETSGLKKGDLIEISNSGKHYFMDEDAPRSHDDVYRITNIVNDVQIEVKPAGWWAIFWFNVRQSKCYRRVKQLLWWI